MLDKLRVRVYNKDTKNETRKELKIMATNHYHIYLGQERGKRVVHKVGQTTQGCWERCRKADYRIGMSFEIFPNCGTYRGNKNCLNEAEKFIIASFTSRFPIDHDREYFRTSKHNWEKTKEIFVADMIQFLTEKGWQYEIHEGWVERGTY